MIAAAMALMLSLPPTQSGGDWDLATTRDAVTATVSFSDGVQVASRCRDGVFDVIIVGLPPATGETRNLKITVGDGEELEGSFSVAAGTAAFSLTPAPLARRLRDGGRLVIRTEATDTVPGWRFVADLPPSTVAVDQTLSSCGRPAVDPRLAQYGIAPGAGRYPNPEWSVLGTGRFPEAALRANIKYGEVVLSCAALPDGRLQDCVVESASPPGAGFEREALLGVRGARLKPFDPVDDARARLVTFTFKQRHL